MTDHPCKGLGTRALKAFDRICAGDPSPFMSKGDVEALLARRLIVRGDDRILSLRLGMLVIPQFHALPRARAQWRASGAGAMMID